MGPHSLHGTEGLQQDAQPQKHLSVKERMKTSKEEKGTQTTATTICKDTQTVSKVNKADVPDMGMQTESEKDRPPRIGPFVKKKKIKRKSPICIAGDSMTKNT